MNTNFKRMSIAMAMVSVVATANGVAAQESGASQMARAGVASVPEAALFIGDSGERVSGAEQIIRIAGMNAVPEASLFLGWTAPGATDRASVADNGAPVQLVADLKASGWRLGGAEQIIRVAGAANVPEASLYVNEYAHQESGASQMARVSGLAAPIAALYYSTPANGFDMATVASASTVTPVN